MPEDMTPELMLDKLGKPAERRKAVSTIETLLLAVMVWIAVGEIVTFQQNKDIQAEQDAGKIRGYIQRATLCDQIKGIGLHEPKGCDAAVIAPYRDPDATVGSTSSAKSSAKTQLLLCYVLQTWARQPGSNLVIPKTMCDE